MVKCISCGKMGANSKSYCIKLNGPLCPNCVILMTKCIKCNETIDLNSKCKKCYPPQREFTARMLHPYNGRMDFDFAKPSQQTEILLNANVSMSPKLKETIKERMNELQHLSLQEQQKIIAEEFGEEAL